MVLVVTGWAVRTLGLAASLERYNFAEVVLAAGKLAAVAVPAAGKLVAVAGKFVAVAGNRLGCLACHLTFAFH